MLTTKQKESDLLFPAVTGGFRSPSVLLRMAGVDPLGEDALFAAAIAKAKSVTTEHVQAAMHEVT